MGGMKDTLGDTPYHLPKPSPAVAYDGETYSAPRDYPRLNKQTGAVFSVMLDGQWRTLAQIATAADAPEASVSARLRDLRKPKYGGHTVERQHVGIGLYRYRLIVHVASPTA